jgi:hypothetical protein
MKAIQTSYGSYRFRSRLEAKWAVFFDAIGVEGWVYEKEGFELSCGLRYLPDFWIPYNAATPPGWGFWVEIKPEPLNPRESFLLGELARETGHRSYAICGQPRPGCYTISVFDHHHGGIPSAIPLVRNAYLVEIDNHQKPGFLEHFAEYGYHPGPDPELRLINGAGIDRGFFEGRAFSTGWTGSLHDALRAANSARFEHGESPQLPPARPWARTSRGWLLPPEMRREAAAL